MNTAGRVPSSNPLKRPEKTTTDDRPQTAALRITHYATHYALRHALRITHYALRITHYALRITHYALRITHYALRHLSPASLFSPWSVLNS